MLPCATENKRLWLRGPHGSSCVRRFFTRVHRQLSSLVERNHVEHPRPDFRHRIFAIIDHRLKYCNRSDPCLNSPREGGEKMDATRRMEKRSELTFRQSRCVFSILRGSDRETKFLSIIRNEVNKNRHPFRLEIFEILFHSLPSNVPRIELPSRKECGGEGKGSEATSGRRPNAAKSSAI